MLMENMACSISVDAFLQNDTVITIICAVNIEDTHLERRERSAKLSRKVSLMTCNVIVRAAEVFKQGHQIHSQVSQIEKVLLTPQGKLPGRSPISWVLDKLLQTLARASWLYNSPDFAGENKNNHSNKKQQLRRNNIHHY